MLKNCQIYAHIEYFFARGYVQMANCSFRVILMCIYNKDVAWIFTTRRKRCEKISIGARDTNDLLNFCQSKSHRSAQTMGGFCVCSTLFWYPCSVIFMTLQPCPFRAESDKPWQNSGCNETIYARNIRNEVAGCSDIYKPHHALFICFQGSGSLNASIQLAFRMAFTY